jgi:hypothetical protein
MGFEKFNPISEGVVHVDPIEPFKGFIVGWRISCRSTPVSELFKASHQERRMRLLGRAKLWIDTKMEPERPSSEPDATAFGKIGGFRLLDEAENSTVKGPRLGFLPGRHRQLHVIESDDLSQSLLVV